MIPCIGASITFYGLAIVRQFETMEVWSLNESLARATSIDLGLPVTAFAHDPKETKEVLELVGGAPVAIKLL